MAAGERKSDGLALIRRFVFVLIREDRIETHHRSLSPAAGLRVASYFLRTLFQGCLRHPAGQGLPQMMGSCVRTYDRMRTFLLKYQVGTRNSEPPTQIVD